ncbi:hypothetical protein F4859DRAFT_454711 [Xylaria cf. heliscus]|nr:hypothetical protein F4859DRAFT_454711 [Xylaria cf. heliscus]
MEHSTTTVQVNPLGLTLLHAPTGEANLQQTPTVNIIFVHGLRGHPRKTWEYLSPVQRDIGGAKETGFDINPAQKGGLFNSIKRKFVRLDTPSRHSLPVAGSSYPTSGNETIYWPASSLPSVVPRAKIWTYGYNADVSGKLFQANTQNSILEHGNDFMVKVERALRNELPIIFVAHSLGGLVVKVAINKMQSSIDDRYQQLSRRIRAVVFCGSPHRGSDAAAWGKLATNLCAMALMDTNSRLLSDLQVDSRILRLVQDDFLKALHRAPLRIHSFQEGRALTGVKGLDSKVVDDFSSQLGWPQETCETIDADHREMVRKPGVRDISDILKDLEQEAVKAAQDLDIEDQVEEPAKKARRMKVLQRLYTSPYEDRKDINPERIHGTCQWFISHQLYQSWQKSATSNLLWVSADPGCGKSVLAKYLVDNLLPGPYGRITCYFFFKDGFDDQKSLESALCCILRQIFVQKPALLSDKILEQFERDEKTIYSSFRSLWDIFTSIASHYNQGEIICILDALDECEGNGRSRIAKAICKLYETEKSTFTLKFLLTSRPYMDIKREFRILENRQPTIHLSGENEVEVDKISKEIDIVIKSQVGKLGEKLQLQPEEEQALQYELTRVPNRTYLWVYLMFDTIEDIISVTEDDLREVIRNIPKTVDAAYDKILSRSPDREKAMRLLHIIVVAQRPLTLREMALALAIKESHRSYTDLRLEPESRFRQTVRELCGLFVTIIDSKIYLLHQTAREFLVQQESADTTQVLSLQTDSLKWKFSLRPVESHRIIAEICIWHLLFDEFKSSSPIATDDITRYTENCVFVDYSAKHWADHCVKARIRSDDPMQYLMLYLLDTERNMNWISIYAYCNGATRSFTSYNALIWASYFGLEGTAKLLLERAAEVDVGKENGRTPLRSVAREGHEAVVRLLLKNGANIEEKDSNGWTALHRAVARGREAVVRLLLQYDCFIDETNNSGETALHLAVSNRTGSGSRSVIIMLLEGGANIDVADKFGRTALDMMEAKDYDEDFISLCRTFHGKRED